MCIAHLPPFELIFGRKANLPQDVLENSNEPVYNFESYKNELKFKLSRSHEIVKQKLLDHKYQRKQQFDNNLNPISVVINDIVYLKNENRSKLDSFYLGPYKILKIVEPNCEIQHILTGKTTNVHKNRIIKA